MSGGDTFPKATGSPVVLHADRVDELPQRHGVALDGGGEGVDKKALSASHKEVGPEVDGQAKARIGRLSQVSTSTGNRRAGPQGVAVAPAVGLLTGYQAEGE